MTAHVKPSQGFPGQALQSLQVCGIIYKASSINIQPWLRKRRNNMRRAVEVHYYIKEGRRADFYNEIIRRGIADAARAEEGNEKYEYYLSPGNENELLLLEI